MNSPLWSAHLVAERTSVEPMGLATPNAVHSRFEARCARDNDTTCPLGDWLPGEPLAVSLWVSTDEEDVRVRVRQGPRQVDLGERLPHFLLLTLARRRIADAQAGLADSDCGWIYVDQFCHDPSMAPSRINLDVCRIRKRLELQGITGATAIFERRRPSRQLRIGTGRLSVTRL